MLNIWFAIIVFVVDDVHPPNLLPAAIAPGIGTMPPTLPIPVTLPKSFAKLSNLWINWDRKFTKLSPNTADCKLSILVSPNFITSPIIFVFFLETIFTVLPANIFICPDSLLSLVLNIK